MQAFYYNTKRGNDVKIDSLFSLKKDRLLVFAIIYTLIYLYKKIQKLRTCFEYAKKFTKLY